MSNYASQWHLSSQHPCKIPMPRSNRHKTAAEDAEEFPMLEHWKAFTETKGGGGDLLNIDRGAGVLLFGSSLFGQARWGVIFSPDNGVWPDNCF